MFKPSTLFYSDGYKIGHGKMLAPGTDYLYGTWIPRSTKHAPKGVTKIVSAGQSFTWRWIHDEFQENFFNQPKEVATRFAEDMSKYLGLQFDGKQFEDLHDLGYLPIKVKSLPEGIETQPNVPHMTFINTVKGFAWLTLYLETIVSSLAWKTPTSATIALKYRRTAEEWVKKTDPAQSFLIPYLCHDFSARGLDPHSMLSSGLGHAMSFTGSDSLIVIPGARYFYGVPEDEVCIASVNASEHSVSTTKIFTVGEQQMLSDWMKIFPTGILSVVSDTFDLFLLITEYLPALKDEIMARDGKLVIRPDSGDPVDIICGETLFKDGKIIDHDSLYSQPRGKGVIELLWDIFGGTINEQGYKVLDSHIGAIYGDSITTDRQLEIYERLAAKGFAATNIVLGVGSFTYQYNTRDTFGFAAKGAWFENNGKGYDIYKDPITDDGTKKSLKGLICVTAASWIDEATGETADIKYSVETECTADQENEGILQVIYFNGEFYNQPTLAEIRSRIDELVTYKNLEA